LERKITEIKKSEKDFMKMGYGVTAYFGFQCQMIFLFVILIALAIPGFWMYNDFDGGDRGSHGLLYKLTIG